MAKRNKFENKGDGIDASKSNINWYPGHMVKAINDIKSVLKLIDIVVEVVDARLPLSSCNPIIEELAQDKQKIMVLNKKDLADETETKNWIKYFESKDMIALAVDSSEPQDIKKIIDAIVVCGKAAYKEKVESLSVDFKPIYRVLIAGIPNVGKSTIINKIAKRNAAEVSNKPGVTVRKQWIRVQDNIELLDTPGLLWPRLDNNNAGEKLALTGNIKQEILELEGLACKGIEFMISNEKYLDMFKEKYKLVDEDIEYMDSYDILELVGRKRGCLMSGGHVDTEKAAKIFVDELKVGKIGRITLESIESEDVK